MTSTSPLPPEVTVDHHGRQILALRENGERFRRYVRCAAGCGYLIGVGDAIEDATHESCAGSLP